MKSKFRLPCIQLFVLFLVISITSPIYATIIKIMPLGDSITEGYEPGLSGLNMVSYRKALHDRLVEAGYDIDFVGSLTNGSAVFADSQHEGHGGWTADEIVNGRPTLPTAGKLSDWLIAESPDVILLHIGTNDIDAAQAPAGIVTEVSQILDVIDQYETNNPA